MKKQITAIISAALILASFTACSNKANAPGDGEQDLVTQGSTETSSNDSSPDTSFLGNTQSESVSDNSSSDFDYDYYMEHRYDNVIKTRGIYGETEIPDIHYENTYPNGSTAHSPFGDSWEYIGLESMVFESHIFGDYTIKLVGKYVRTDKEYFPGRIFADSLCIEVEKNGVKLSKDGFYTHPVLDLGPQFCPEITILTDKIGSYLDFYDLEYPVISMRYYYNNDSIWESGLDRSVDFAIIKDGKCLSGFGAVCEPGCGRHFDTDVEKFTVNKGFTTCKTTVFEADKFKVIDKNTLFDEKAGITYTFKFTDPQQFDLYTAEKNVGSIAASSKEDWIDCPFRY